MNFYKHTMPGADSENSERGEGPDTVEPTLGSVSSGLIKAQ